MRTQWGKGRGRDASLRLLLSSRQERTGTHPRNPPSAARRKFREACHLLTRKRAELGPRSGSDRASHWDHPEGEGAAAGLE